MTLLYTDPSAIIFLIFVGIIVLIFISLPVTIIYFVYRWLTKKGYKFIGLFMILIVSLGTIYSVYTAIYPTDSFYFDEFTEVTLRQPPKTAKIIRKSASYPDFHGDYCSTSLMKLSKQEYNALLKALQIDKRLIKKVELIRSSELSEVMGDLRAEQIKFNFTRKIKGEEDHYLYIGFFDDLQSIIVYVSVT